jgi:hypothetical protein
MRWRDQDPPFQSADIRLMKHTIYPNGELEWR